MTTGEIDAEHISCIENLGDDCPSCKRNSVYENHDLFSDDVDYYICKNPHCNYEYSIEREYEIQPNE